MSRRPERQHRPGSAAKENIVNAKVAAEKTKNQSEEERSQVPATQAPGSALTVVNFGDDAGAGMENVSRDEYRIPLVRILQANSPQVEEGPGRVVGAKAGDLFNTGTGEIIDGAKGLEFVPWHRDHNYVEWTPRSIGGGGFVAIHPVDDPRILELKAQQGKFGKLWTGTKRNNDGTPADGTEIGESFYLYGFLIQEGSPQPVVIAFTSTQIRKYQGFMGRYMGLKYRQKVKGTEDQYTEVTPPLWAHRWFVQTVPESNKKGKFFGWRITLAGKKPDGSEDAPVRSLIPMSDPLYAAAKEMWRQAAAGVAKADMSKAGADGPATDEDPM
jgi:hypothetical protein